MSPFTCHLLPLASALRLFPAGGRDGFYNPRSRRILQLRAFDRTGSGRGAALPVAWLIWSQYVAVGSRCWSWKLADSIHLECDSTVSRGLNWWSVVLANGPIQSDMSRGLPQFR